MISYIHKEYPSFKPSSNTILCGLVETDHQFIKIIFKLCEYYGILLLLLQPNDKFEIFC